MDEEKMELMRECDRMYQRWEEDLRELHRFLDGEIYVEYRKVVKEEQLVIQEIRQNL